MSIEIYGYKGIKNKSLIPLYLLMLFFIACSNDKVIDENKFVKVYADLVIAQDTLIPNKEVFDSVKTKIFKKYGVTFKQYNYTISYYNKDVKRWESFFSQAIAYIDTLRSKKTIGDRK